MNWHELSAREQIEFIRRYPELVAQVIWYLNGRVGRDILKEAFDICEEEECIHDAHNDIKA